MATITRTIGAAGDIATAQAWLDDINTNGNGWYTSGDIADGVLLEDQLGSSVIMTWPAANATSPISKAIFRPTPGGEHNGVKGAGVRVSSTNPTGNVMTIGTSVNYDVTIEDLEIETVPGHSSWNQNRCLELNILGSREIIMRRLLVHSFPHPAANGTPWGIWDRRGGVKFIRCCVSGFFNATTGKGTGIIVSQVANPTDILGCTIDNCYEFGVLSDLNDAVILKNNIVMGNGVDYSGPFSASSDRNMSSDLTAPGATAYPSESRALIWTDPDNSDWTLLPGTNSNANGDDLGSAYEENIDIQNNLVSGDWDLGAYHLGIVIPPGSPVSGQRRMHMLGF